MSWKINKKNKLSNISLNCDFLFQIFNHDLCDNKTPNYFFNVLANYKKVVLLITINHVTVMSLALNSDWLPLAVNHSEYLTDLVVVPSCVWPDGGTTVCGYVTSCFPAAVTSGSSSEVSMCLLIRPIGHSPPTASSPPRHPAPQALPPSLHSHWKQTQTQTTESKLTVSRGVRDESS